MTFGHSALNGASISFPPELREYCIIGAIKNVKDRGRGELLQNVVLWIGRNCCSPELKQLWLPAEDVYKMKSVNIPSWMI